MLMKKSSLLKMFRPPYDVLSMKNTPIKNKTKQNKKKKNIEILYTSNVIRKYEVIQLVPIKTLQSLHAKFRTINETFETNLDCTIITRD